MNANERESPSREGDLEGLRIVDASTLLAGPLAASLLADHGATTVKVESPDGDPLRGYPPFDAQGRSLVHKVTNRNKMSVIADLHSSQGRRVLLDLAAWCDVFVTNFRTRTLQRWGLDFDTVSRLNPRIIFLHVSAFGRTGPYSDRPGFARVAEALSGLTEVTGFPDGPPTLAGYPIADAITGLQGAQSVVQALYASRTKEGSLPRLIDLGLYEPLVRLFEDMYIGGVASEHSRERVGNLNPFVAPNNMFRASDGRHVVIPASTDGVFRRLATVIGEGMAERAEYRTNRERLRHREQLEGQISRWVAARPADVAVARLVEAEVPAGVVLSPVDVPSDEQVVARGNFTDVLDPESGERLRMQAPLPIGAGRIRYPGRPLGADMREVLTDLLEYPPGEVDAACIPWERESSSV